MNAHTFKIVLTVVFTLPLVMKTISFVIKHMVRHWIDTGKISPAGPLEAKVSLDLTWIINPILIYGVWNWL